MNDIPVGSKAIVFGCEEELSEWNNLVVEIVAYRMIEPRAPEEVAIIFNENIGATTIRKRYIKEANV